MTRKHFEAIAQDILWQVSIAREELAEHPASTCLDRLHVLSCDLAATFSTFNFNRTRFLTACGF